MTIGKVYGIDQNTLQLHAIVHNIFQMVSFDKMFLHCCTEVLMPLLAVAFVSKLIVQTKIWIVSTVYKLGEFLKLCWGNVSAHASVFEDKQRFFISFMLNFIEQW